MKNHTKNILLNISIFHIFSGLMETKDNVIGALSELLSYMNCTGTSNSSMVQIYCHNYTGLERGSQHHPLISDLKYDSHFCPWYLYM